MLRTCTLQKLGFRFKRHRLGQIGRNPSRIGLGECQFLGPMLLHKRFAVRQASFEHLDTINLHRSQLCKSTTSGSIGVDPSEFAIIVPKLIALLKTHALGNLGHDFRMKNVHVRMCPINPFKTFA